MCGGGSESESGGGSERERKSDSQARGHSQMESHSDRSDQVIVATSPHGLRLAIVGTECIEENKTHQMFTMYRTLAIFENEAHERLLRFSQFHDFLFHQLPFHDKKLVLKHIKFPKRHWRRQTSLKEDVVKHRVDMLNQIVKEIASADLSSDGVRALHRLLQIGEFRKDALMPRIPNLENKSRQFIRNALLTAVCATARAGEKKMTMSKPSFKVDPKAETATTIKDKQQDHHSIQAQPSANHKDASHSSRQDNQKATNDLETSTPDQSDDEPQDRFFNRGATNNVTANPEDNKKVLVDKSKSFEEKIEAQKQRIARLLVSSSDDTTNQVAGFHF